jgi:formylmethanofuran dehydrogenase subunit E|nr:MAG TPA: hypothetical protein [Caudoviricetes sp.]
MEKIMEKIEEKIVEEKRKIHKFYCDECGEYLGESEEYGDEYYDKIGYISQRVIVNGKQYIYKSHLCDKCKEKFYEDLGNVLEVVGFVKVE